MRMDRYMRSAKQLVLQPRMGFSGIDKMRLGLTAVRDFEGARIGTITLDAHTRQRQWAEAQDAVRNGTNLNGFPIVTYGAAVTQEMLVGILSEDFPVQVRHGSPLPQRVFEVAAQAGIDSIEGGPISYCLPYGRVPLEDCVSAWGDAVKFWADEGRRRGATNHLESFAGCMMGQLAPPSLLVALSVIEGLFFAERGILSLSLSHAQGTNFSQDVGAVLALRQLGEEYLPHGLSWHLVLYTWMGVFPQSTHGARRLIEDSAVIASVAGAERLIVKTTAEAFQIPTIEDNINALRWAAASAKKAKGIRPNTAAIAHAEMIHREARQIVEMVLGMASSLDHAILRAFERGVLDIPFCFHPDNKNSARASIDSRTGVIDWDRPGSIPVVRQPNRSRPGALFTAADLLNSLTHNQRKYDERYNNE
jgi:methylaspartate mutase epsilon subunit